MIRRSGKISKDFGEALDRIKIAFPMPVQPEGASMPEASPAPPVEATPAKKPRKPREITVKDFIRAKQLQERTDEKGNTAWDVLDPMNGSPMNHHIVFDPDTKEYNLIDDAIGEVVHTNADISRLMAYVYTSGKLL